jgi:hypothetical protein
MRTSLAHPHADFMRALRNEIAMAPQTPLTAGKKSADT